MASPISAQPPVKNTFIHFNINRFDIKAFPTVKLLKNGPGYQGFSYAD